MKAGDLKNAELGTFFRALREGKKMELSQLSELAQVSLENLRLLEEGLNAEHRPLSELHRVLTSMNASENDFYELSVHLGKLTTRKFY